MAAGRRPPGPPAAPFPYKKLFALITGGNVFVRIGVLVLFFGVAFLLKYASEHHHLPPQIRLLSAAALAAGLLVAGWRLRRRTRGYALVLQGGGVGLLYLTAFAALRLYQLLPADAVFLILCLVVAFSAMLAVAQDALWLAVMASLGGFLAPVLVSTGQGSHVILFSYYLLLNIGIFGMALYRSWRALNVLGFVCTFIIASAWGALKYQPEYFSSTEPFLIAFFLLYTGIALLYALRQSVRLAYYADGTLIFGVPLVGFGLQTGMVHGWEYATAWSALGLALFYFGLAVTLYRARRDLRILTEAFLALGAGFATLAIPLAFDAYWTSAAWALEGAGIAWTGLRQRRGLMLFSGTVLQWAGGIAFLMHDGSSSPLFPIVNTETLGNLFLALAGLFSAWYMDRSSREPGYPLANWCAPLSKVMLLWGVVWWAHGGADESARLAAGVAPLHLHDLLLFTSLSLLSFSFAARALRWPSLGLLGILQAPALLASLVALSAFGLHPSQDWGWFAWPSALVCGFVVLRHLEDQAEAISYLPLWHIITFLGSLIAVTWEFDWQLQWPHDEIWRVPLTAAIPASALLLLSLRGRDWIEWPVNRFAGAYTGWASALIAAYLWIWLLVANASTDSSRSLLPYVPPLDPLDAVQLLALAAFACWLRALDSGAAVLGAPSRPVFRFPPDWLMLTACFAGFAAFACVNGMLIRSLCYWLAIPFDWDSLMHSQMVQMSLSILWTVCALGIMVYAARRRLRVIWFVGAVLMTIEVAKLFIVDLSSAGSLERIVSFIVVGGLLLLIGYFSPLPPASTIASDRPST